MKNMKISMKLIVGFLIVVMLSVVIGATGIYGLTSMGTAADTMYSKKALPLGDLARATEYFMTCRIQARSAILYTGDADRLKAIESDINDSLAQFETALDNYEPTIQTERGFQLFAAIKDNYATFKPSILEVLNHAKQGASQEDLLNEMGATLDSTNMISSSLSDLTQARMGVMGDANNANMQLESLLLIVIIAVIAVSAGVSMILAVYISRLFSKPIGVLTTFMIQAGSTGDISLRPEDVKNIEKYSRIKDEIGQCINSSAQFVTRLQDISKALETVAGGDLTANISLLSENDTMGGSLRRMVENLNSMFEEIQSSTMQVSTGAKQIANGAQALAQGSTEQASAVEELSSSIGEISERTSQSADMANEAANLSGEIKDNAEKGSTQMDHMMQAVKEINEASGSIGKVIKVIDDIAFQTNILALNAAVEAARAGQHGKGFAVVAEEVRNLAAKSAEAAKDTGGLIENSIDKANLGLRIANETAASLREIVGGINRSAEIILQIAQASDEQARAITQINTGIGQVAQVVQQNSATAQESAAASEEMSGQSIILEDLLAQFKLKEPACGRTLPPGAESGRKLSLPGKTYENGQNFGKY